MVIFKPSTNVYTLYSKTWSRLIVALFCGIQKKGLTVYYIIGNLTILSWIFLFLLHHVGRFPEKWSNNLVKSEESRWMRSIQKRWWPMQKVFASNGCTMAGRLAPPSDQRESHTMFAKTRPLLQNALTPAVVSSETCVTSQFCVFCPSERLQV